MTAAKADGLSSTEVADLLEQEMQAWSLLLSGRWGGLGLAGVCQGWYVADGLDRAGLVSAGVCGLAREGG